jgi:tetratricopeptide (TPR) repeat protein
MKEHDFASLWIEDANLALHRGNKESARIMFDVAVELHPLDQRLWEGYIGLESRLEERVKYRKVLERAAAVEGETAQPFLLRLSKELVRAGEIAKAVELLKTSMEKQPKSEVLCLAYAEILKQLKHGDECRKLLLNARKTIDSVTVWRYHIKLERDLGNINKALEVSKEASARFPYNVDVACDLSTVYEEMNQFDKARENYLSLTKIPKCQKQSRPWIQYVLFENRVAGPQKVGDTNLGKNNIRSVQEVHQRRP